MINIALQYPQNITPILTKNSAKKETKQYIFWTFSKYFKLTYKVQRRLTGYKNISGISLSCSTRTEVYSTP